MHYLSPATRHRLRVEAEQHADHDASGPALGRSEYDVLLYQLKLDGKTLSDIQSKQAKAEQKATLLPRYQPWLDGVLNAKNPRQDDAIYSTCLIWHIDAGQLNRAAQLGQFALKHGFVAPDQFKRSLATILFEELAIAVLSGQSLELAAAEQLNLLLDSHSIDMPDQVRSRWHKAVAKLYETAGQPEAALPQLKQALNFDPRAGVKTDIKRLEPSISKP